MYIWERFCLNDDGSGQGEPPDGYKLHSWRLLGERCVVVCWERVE